MNITFNYNDKKSFLKVPKQMYCVEIFLCIDEDEMLTIYLLCLPFLYIFKSMMIEGAYCSPKLIFVNIYTFVLEIEGTRLHILFNYRTIIERNMRLWSTLQTKAGTEP